MVGHRHQHGINVRPGQDLPKVVVGLDAVVAGLAKFGRIDLIAAPLGVVAALLAHVAHGQDLDIVARDVAPGHISPGPAQQMAAPLPAQADETHVDPLARGGRAVAPESGRGNERRGRQGGSQSNRGLAQKMPAGEQMHVVHNCCARV